MTHQEKLAAVRAAIIAVVPEIMELKFGCEILRYKNHPEQRTYKVIEEIGYAADPSKVWLNSVPFGSMPVEIGKTDISGDWEILGRAIRISDVLRAVNKVEMRNMEYRQRDNLSVSCTGVFLGLGYSCRLNVNQLPQYNLADDDLNHQSENTIAFLHDILCKPQ